MNILGGEKTVQRSLRGALFLALSLSIVTSQGAESLREIEGHVRVRYLDNAQAPEKSQLKHEIVTASGEVYEIRADPGLPLPMQSGAYLRLTGDVIGSTVDLGSREGSLQTLSSAANIKNENLGRQEILILNVAIGGGAPLGSNQQIEGAIFGSQFGSVKDYYEKTSYNKVTLGGRVIGPLNISATACNPDVILAEALQAADSLVQFASYSRIIVLTPGTECTQGSGLASVGKEFLTTPQGEIHASIAWLFTFSQEIIAHELGHNFGALHSNLGYCTEATTQVPYSSSCESVEYGDRFDVMGGTYAHMNALNKENLGWLSEQDSVVTTNGGRFTLAPLQSLPSSTSFRQIKIPLENEDSFFPGRNDVFYSLEYRQPVDYDATYINTQVNPTAFTGIAIRIGRLLPEEFSYSNTNILSMHPFKDGGPPPGEPRYYPLQVGERFYDETHGIQVTLNGISSSGADVTVSRAPSPAKIIDPAPGSMIRSNSVLFQWTQNYGVTEHWLGVGTTPESVSASPWGDVFRGSVGLALSHQVDALPLKNKKLYVRLWSKINQQWKWRDYTFDLGFEAASIYFPETGALIDPSSLTLRWDTGAGVDEYWVGVGTTAASVSSSPWGNVFARSVGLQQSLTLKGLPIYTAGSTTPNKIYVRLWSKTNGVWQYRDYWYQIHLEPAVIHTPEVRYPLDAGTEVTFSWTTGSGATKYYIGFATRAEFLGKAPWGDLAAFDMGTAQSIKFVVPRRSQVPEGYERLHVRLWTLVAGQWRYVDHAFDILDF